MSPDNMEMSGVKPEVVLAVADVLGAGVSPILPRKPHLEQGTGEQTKPIFDAADSGPYANVKDGREMSW